MHWIPPTSQQQSLVSNKSQEAAEGLTKQETRILRSKLRVYNSHVRRFGRGCSTCSNGPLARSRMRFQVIDENRDPYDPDNVQILCPRCCRKVERPTAEHGTGVSLAQVRAINRDGNKCVYCGRGPLYGVHAAVAPVVDKPDPGISFDWTCCCRTCLNDRGDVDHMSYIKVCAQRHFDQWAFLREYAEGYG